MTAETDITAINDGGANTALEVRSALTSVLARANTDPFLTTKGDLLTHTTGPARLGVGTDGQALVADSTVAAGVKWGDVGGIGIQWPLHALTTGMYVPPFLGAFPSGGVVSYTGDVIRYFPFISSRGFSTNTLAFRMGSTTAAPGFKLGIYSDSDGTPATLLASGTEAGTISAHAGTDVTLGSSVTIEGGTLYWLAFLMGTTVAVYSVAQPTAEDAAHSLALTIPTTLGNALGFASEQAIVFYTESMFYGTGLPASATPVLNTSVSNTPSLAVKVT